MNTTIVNLYGGPGTGKSTSAAYLYYKLKNANRNVELIREYVKDWAWEGRAISAYDQVYLLGKQARRESLLYGKVEVIVTDSPLIQQICYAERYAPSLALCIREMVFAFNNQAVQDGHRMLHVFLKRTKPYSASGRFQTEEQARYMDDGIQEVLRRYRVTYTNCGTTESELDELLSKV